MSDLLDRLRAVESGRGTGDHVSNWHRNPDGPEAAAEIEKLRSLVRFQDRVIRSGDTATLTDAERSVLTSYGQALARMAEDFHDNPLHSMNLDTIRGLLERFPSALSPMTLPPQPEDGEDEDERIWRSDKDQPDA